MNLEGVITDSGRTPLSGRLGNLGLDRLLIEKKGLAQTNTVRANIRTETRATLWETLIAWDAEGGCEAAYPHHCWLEPDGPCADGDPSWLLKPGFI